MITKTWTLGVIRLTWLNFKHFVLTKIYRPQNWIEPRRSQWLFIKLVLCILFLQWVHFHFCPYYQNITECRGNPVYRKLLLHRCIASARPSAGMMAKKRRKNHIFVVKFKSDKFIWLDIIVSGKWFSIWCLKKEGKKSNGAFILGCRFANYVQSRQKRFWWPALRQEMSCQ